MSVQTQIDRLNKAKSDLKTSITNKGVTVSDDALISDYPALVDSIETGSDLKLKDVQSVSYSSNGSYNVLPEDGYDGMAKVIVDVNVPSKEFSGQTKTVSYSSNGSYKVKPDEGYDGLDEVDVTVDVAGGSGWKAPSVISFYGCTDDVLDVTGVDFSGLKGIVTSSSTKLGLFGKFTGSEIRGLAGSIGYVERMFEGTSAIPDLSTVSLPVNCKYMFYNTDATSIDASSLDTSNVTNMNSMFSLNFSLTSINLTGLDTSNATNMGGMFSYDRKLTSIDVSGLDTSKATDLSTMFSNCSGLTSLDLSNFITNNVEDVSSMFYSCPVLTSIDISNFNLDKVKSGSYYINNMFKNCDNLTTVKVVNCNDDTKQKILAQLQKDLSSKTWTLGDDGIITGVASS